MNEITNDGCGLYFEIFGGFGVCYIWCFEYTWLMGSSTVRCGPVGVSGLLEKVHHCERGL